MRFGGRGFGRVVQSTLDTATLTQSLSKREPEVGFGELSMPDTVLQALRRWAELKSAGQQYATVHANPEASSAPDRLFPEGIGHTAMDFPAIIFSLPPICIPVCVPAGTMGTRA